MKPNYAIVTFFLLTMVHFAEARTWTALSGKTVEAEYVKIESGTVWLRGPDGNLMTTGFHMFIAEDQELIKVLYEEGLEKAAAAAVAAQEEEVRLKAEKRAEVLAKWKPGQVISFVTPDKTAVPYHVYIPTSFDPDKLFPLVYAFSPGGNGKGQLNAMKKSAEKAGWIVVGCDKLKNGMKDEDLEIEMEDAVLADVQKNVPHDRNRMYLSGMSGGAMRSYQIASRRHDIGWAGILAFGGWMGGSEYQKKLDFPRGLSVAMINGDKDTGANAWMDSDSKVIKKSRGNVEDFSFPGGHAMAPPEVIDEAIEWLQSQPLPE
jgi:poly(3-hydroxybutyrate) depolymerase